MLQKKSIQAATAQAVFPIGVRSRLKAGRGNRSRKRISRGAGTRSNPARTPRGKSPRYGPTARWRKTAAASRWGSARSLRS